MKRQAVPPTGAAQTFEVNESFFSTTDERGIITSGNRVFSRTSGYELSELIGQAHNIIRHPDMPRCVFRLLWRQAQSGASFMGYVKNHAKNGNHYWVFALIIPVGKNLLSIRIKPITPWRETLESLYASLLETEEDSIAAGHSEAEAMDRSEAKLNATIRDLNYASYDAFSRRCLDAEIAQRDAELERRRLDLFPKNVRLRDDDFGLSQLFHATHGSYQKLSELLPQLESFVKASEQIRSRQAKVRNAAEDFRLHALNANIAAETLGASAITIGTITQFLHECAGTLSRDVQALDQEIGSTNRSVTDIATNLTVGRLQFEMLLSFLAELASSAAESQSAEQLVDMTEALRIGLKTTLSQSREALLALRKNIPKLRDTKERIRKVVINLNVAQIAGLTESSRIQEGQGLRTMFEDLRQRVSFTQAEMSQIDQAIDQLAKLTASAVPKVEAASAFLQRQITENK